MDTLPYGFILKENKMDDYKRLTVKTDNGYELIDKTSDYCQIMTRIQFERAIKRLGYLEDLIKSYDK